MTDTVLISLKKVSKIHNEGRPNEVQAVVGIDLDIARGKVTVLRGASGSGKTTLLTVIGCLARPSSGRVALDGRDISGMPERFLTRIRQETFGFVFQGFNLLRGMSALENIMLPAYPQAPPHRWLRRRALDLLSMLRLEHRADTPVEMLSGGEAQRTAIARALVNDPPILIADEPTANLDTALTREFLGIAETLKAQGKTLILTSHDPRVFEAGMVDHVVTLRDGRVEERR